MENEVPERRQFTRYQCSLPVLLHELGQAHPTSCETTDLGLGGCYVKLLFPLPVGAVLDIRIGTAGGEIKAKGVVTTADPTLGNGIEFTEMAPSSKLELERYLQTLPEASKEPGAVIPLNS